ncbi:MAG TPA: peptidylprolyl isomerase [Gemmatimonadota bacterium]|nr:peptidylprolyl isomerase [Gemmatimonadota bacterium]
MTRRINWLPPALVTALALSTSACTDTIDALTSHARPVAVVGGEKFGTDELATMLAESPLPDSALTAHWAARVGRLWADYVSLALLYQSPDTTSALDYDPLLEDARYYPALAVQRYRDSVVLGGLDPAAEEVREYYEQAQPLTRLDVRRIRLGIPPDASDAVRDSLFAEAERLRRRVASGADFIEVARTASDEPAASRGQVLSYQGHSDFHPAADSVVFHLRPGEISPVIVAEDEIVFYRIERRRSPEFESVEDMVRRDLVDLQREQKLEQAADSLLENSRRVVADGAADAARLVATSDDRGAGRVAGSLRLVRYEGGAFTVSELRELFAARPDLERLFGDDDTEDGDIEVYLYHLAGDEILVRAASESGIELSDEARADLRTGVAGQLAAIAGRMDLSHRLVTNPAYDVGRESRRFVSIVLDRQAPVPQPTEFRAALDQRYPTRVDERSAEAAARLAREQRGLGLEESSAPVTNEGVVPPVEPDDVVPPVDDEDESTTAEDAST